MHKRHEDIEMEKKVLGFLKRFDGNAKDVFTNGCCYWFARVLEWRFLMDEDGWVRDNVVIMYDQVENHFGVKIFSRVYDITGDVTDKYEWVAWFNVVHDDPLLAKRIVRDCILF